ncbi:MAG TPA: xanthine dehydrogenase family protein subunit M [Rhodocyclaceae bacterium]|nr:xanthine dehydrogenase family protein subunit M [Rhodocyclaceae bacterium]
MTPFAYQRPARVDEAIAAGADRGARFVAGGTNLLDLMKIDVEEPAVLIDINRLPLAAIEATPAGVRIGALARMADVAAHPAIVDGYPAVSQALLASASPQLRNMASIGGNLMQRTRCTYFRDTAFPCNKRVPGSGCSAIPGDHRRHAVLGVSSACIAAHASDLAVALVALDASLRLRGPRGERSLPLDDFYRLPGDTPQVENALQPGEMIVAVDLPASSPARRSLYLKIRDRASFEFALVSAAVGLDLAGGAIREARVALGGVGAKPWRARAAEDRLRGQVPGPEVFAAAAGAALEGAQPHPDNAFKVELARRTLVRALGQATT